MKETECSLLDRLTESAGEMSGGSGRLSRLLSELEMVLQSKAAAPAGYVGEGTIMQYGIQLAKIDALPGELKMAEVGVRLRQAIVDFEPRLGEVQLLSYQHSPAGRIYSFGAQFEEQAVFFAIVWDDALDSAAIRHSINRF